MANTELKAALYDLVVAAGNWDRHDPVLNAAEDLLTKALSDLRYRQEHVIMLTKEGKKQDVELLGYSLDQDGEP